MKNTYPHLPWAPLSASEIKAKQDQKLAAFIHHKVAPFSPYYRQLFADCQIDPRSIRSRADLAALPFTDKTHISATPEHPNRPREFVLQPDPEQLRKDWRNIAQALLLGKNKLQQKLQREYRPTFLTSTTGRSSEPVPFLYSQHDIDNLCRSGTQIIDLVRGTPEDRIVNMFPFAPHLGFWQVHYAAQASGIFCLSTGGGKAMGTDGNLRIIQKIKPTVLVGMPTFVYHVFTQALEENIPLPGIQKIVLGGEKVPNGLRRKLHALAQQLGSPNTVVMATYGFTEAKVAWIQPPYPVNDEPSGYLINPELGIVEIIDPESGKVLPDHSPGEIVYTPIDARGSVVLRYRTGDYISEGLTHERCPYTHLEFPRLMGKISRKSEFKEIHIDKIKGSLVDFNELEHILDDIPSIRSWQIELRKKNDDPMAMDELIINVNKEKDASESEVSQHIKEQFSQATEISPNAIQYYSSSEMRQLHGVGNALKEEKIVDSRPREKSPNPGPAKPAWVKKQTRKTKIEK